MQRLAISRAQEPALAIRKTAAYNWTEAHAPPQWGAMEKRSEPAQTLASETISRNGSYTSKDDIEIARGTNAT